MIYCVHGILPAYLQSPWYTVFTASYLLICSLHVILCSRHPTCLSATSMIYCVHGIPPAYLQPPWYTVFAIPYMLICNLHDIPCSRYHTCLSATSIIYCAQCILPACLQPPCSFPRYRCQLLWVVHSSSLPAERRPMVGCKNQSRSKTTGSETKYLVTEDWI